MKTLHTFRFAGTAVAAAAAALLFSAGCQAQSSDRPSSDGAGIQGPDAEGPAAADARAQQPGGLAVSVSTKCFEQTYDDLLAALGGIPPITVLAEIDHSANSAGVGLDLPPTREVFFGNPRLGKPLMQSGRTAGIDLPQKILVWEDAEGTVRVAYNTPTYLRARHRLGGVNSELKTIGQALANLSTAATGADADRPPRGPGPLGRDAGLVTVESRFSAAETFERLQNLIDAAPPLTILFALDHAANAASVGLSLPPTAIVVFGNPALGTPLMQSQRTVAIDLPQKFLVYETDDGDVLIAWNDPRFIARRHGITDRDAEIGTIAGALAGLAAQAAGTADATQ